LKSKKGIEITRKYFRKHIKSYREGGLDESI